MGGAPAPGSDRIPVELFQILKDDAVESAALNMQYAICTQYAGSRHGTTDWFQTGKGVHLKAVFVTLLI